MAHGPMWISNLLLTAWSIRPPARNAPDVRTQNAALLPHAGRMVGPTFRRAGHHTQHADRGRSHPGVGLGGRYRHEPPGMGGGAAVYRGRLRFVRWGVSASAELALDLRRLF